MDERAEKMRRAEALFREVAGTLDREVGSCAGCGGYKYRNRSHYQMGVELDAMAAKCEKFGRRFREGLDRDFRPGGRV